ncbi:MAG: hypothetical protein AB1430_23730 [Pseudomonadota bacterium]
MSDINRGSPAPAEDDEFSAAPPALPSEADSGAHWRALITQIGSEIAGPLTAAMERVTALAATGKIDRQNLRMLREEVAAARHAGMVAQQLARFASGAVRQSHERLHLTRLLKDVLVQRGRDLQARGLPLRQMLKSAEVIADASLLFALLNALLDWCADHARSAIDVRVGHVGWPVQARLSCRFAYRLADDLPRDAPHPPLDSLTWRLVQQTGWTMGLVVEREDSGIETTASITFPRTVNRDGDGMNGLEIDEGFPSSQNSRPLAGSHVLVLASRREVRTQLREAIAHMGLVLDFVTSIDEAREFCAGGVPHAIVYESVLGGERLDRLRDELRQEVPQLVFVEILEEGDTFQVTGAGMPVARVGREGLATSLPSALVFELSKNL